jgi:hypothetical protein
MYVQYWVDLLHGNLGTSLDAYSLGCGVRDQAGLVPGEPRTKGDHLIEVTAAHSAQGQADSEDRND